MRVPVHEPFAAEAQALLEEVEERRPHGPHADRIQREASAFPIARTAELAELAEDARLVLVLPRPDAFHQLLAAEVVSRLLFLLENQSFHGRLRGDAGVIGAGHPLGVEA